MEGWKDILVKIPTSLYERLKKLSKLLGVPMSQIIRNATIDYVTEKEKEVQEKNNKQQ